MGQWTRQSGQPARERLAVYDPPDEDRRLSVWRPGETPGSRQRRVAEYQKQRRQDHELMSERAQAFDFKPEGEGTVNGRRCFNLAQAPTRNSYFCKSLIQPARTFLLCPNRTFSFCCDSRGRLPWPRPFHVIVFLRRSQHVRLARSLHAQTCKPDAPQAAHPGNVPSFEPSRPCSLEFATGRGTICGSTRRRIPDSRREPAQGRCCGSCRRDSDRADAAVAAPTRRRR